MVTAAGPPGRAHGRLDVVEGLRLQSVASKSTPGSPGSTTVAFVKDPWNQQVGLMIIYCLKGTWSDCKKRSCEGTGCRDTSQRVFFHCSFGEEMQSEDGLQSVNQMNGSALPHSEIKKNPRQGELPLL